MSAVISCVGNVACSERISARGPLSTLFTTAGLTRVGATSIGYITETANNLRLYAASRV